MDQVNAYSNKIRRLVGIVGFMGEKLERIIKLVIVTGFPDYIFITLLHLPNILTRTIGD